MNRQILIKTPHMSEYFSLTILEQKYSHKRVYAAGYIFVRAHTQAGQWRGSTKSFLISTFIEVGLNDIRTVQACISTKTKWIENIFGSKNAKISCQIMVKSEGF